MFDGLDELTEELKTAIRECDIEKSNLDEVLDAIEDELTAYLRENWEVGEDVDELFSLIFFDEDGDFSYGIGYDSNQILEDSNVDIGTEVVVAAHKTECYDFFYEHFIESGKLTKDKIAAINKYIKNKANKEYYYNDLLNENEELDIYDEDGKISTDSYTLEELEKLFAEVFPEEYNEHREECIEVIVGEWMRCEFGRSVYMEAMPSLIESIEEEEEEECTIEGILEGIVEELFPEGLTEELFPEDDEAIPSLVEGIEEE